MRTVMQRWPYLRTRPVQLGLGLLCLAIVVLLIRSYNESVRTPVDANQLVGHAIERTRELQSAHFSLTVKDGAIRLGPSLEVVQAEGDVARPDSLRVRATARMGGLLVESELVQSDAGTFYENPFSRRWERLPSGILPVPLLDPDRGIARLMSLVDGLHAQDSQLAGSVRVWRVVGQVPAPAVTALVGGQPVNGLVDVDALVGEDGLVRHLVLSGAVVDGELPSTTRSLDFTEFDSAPIIDVPNLSQ